MAGRRNTLKQERPFPAPDERHVRVGPRGSVPGPLSIVMLRQRRFNMVNTSKPTKEQVREYMERRQAQHQPPPSCQEIRRQLGWDLIEAEREERKKRR